MSGLRFWRGSLALGLLIVLAAPVAARADDSLATARELYAAASYEDALAMLDRLRTPADVPGTGRTIAQYRAFCLFALGRTAEAEHAIETVVATEPSFQPTDADASPRVRAAFGQVRGRVLPGIIQQKYGFAKDAFDRKEFAVAADGFKLVAEMLDDPDVRDAAKSPPLSDLRTLNAGFRELSVTAAAPPPLPPPLPPPPVPEPVPVKVARAPHVYSADDPSVVPPDIVRQTMPVFRFKPTAVGRIIVAVDIDEHGAVEGVKMVALLDPEYDRLVLAAARTWQYRPATLDGVPVKYRKVIQLNLNPR
jgi:Gram-negative bacterial TonB protein C-terminal